MPLTLDSSAATWVGDKGEYRISYVSLEKELLEVYSEEQVKAQGMVERE